MDLNGNEDQLKDASDNPEVNGAGKKRNIYAVAAAVALIAMAAGALIFFLVFHNLDFPKETSIKPVFSEIEAIPDSAGAADWKRGWKKQTLQGTGLSFETPFELTQTDLGAPKDFTTKVVTYEYPNDTIYVQVNYAEYTVKLKTDLDRKVKAILDLLQQTMSSQGEFKDFSYKIEPAEINGIIWAKAKGVFTFNNEKGSFIYMMFVKGNEFWQVQCTYSDIMDKYPQIAERIINSVKIEGR